MQILIPFRSHLRVARHEIRKVFSANKSFLPPRGGEGGGWGQEGPEEWGGGKVEERSMLLLDGLSEGMRDEVSNGVSFWKNSK